MEEEVQKKVLSFIEENKFDNAIMELDSYLVLNNKDADAHALKAMAILEEGIYPEKALKEAEAAMKIENFHFYRFLAGASLLELDKVDDAIKLLQSAADEYEDDSDYLIKLAEAYERSNDLKLALKAIIRALKIEPDNPELIAMKASLLVDLSREREALVELNRLKKILPELAHAYYIEAEAFSRLEKFQDAKKSISKALELSVNMPNADYFERASDVEAFMENYDSAISYIENAIELEPENERFKLIKGSILLDSGKDEEAKSYALEVSRNEPTNPVLSFMAIDVLSTLEDKENFEKYLKEMKLPDSVSTLSKLYFGMEDEISDENIEKSLMNLSKEVKGNEFFEELTQLVYENLIDKADEEKDLNE
ncbi:MAG: tetratricopeptide repeat protein [Thermoplasmataceae archaeon]